MNKKNLTYISSSVFIGLVVLLVFVIVFNNNKNNNIKTAKLIKAVVPVAPIVTIDPIISKKYEDPKYAILGANKIFCNKDLVCAFDVLKSCTKSTFLALSKAEETGYIISVFGIDESDKTLCNFSMTNGSDHKKILNCSLNYKDLDQNVFNSIFEFKDHLKYCK